MFNRNPWTSRLLRLQARGSGDYYDEDGIWTTHLSDSFTGDARFQRAYQRAVRASGADYKVRWRAHTLIWAAEIATNMDGAFVECGTGRGFMMSAVCDYLDWGERPLFLFDTFMPTLPDEAGVQASDGPAVSYYASDAEAVAQNFAEWPGVKLIVGKIPATLTREQIDQVAFLHIDMNHPLPEEAAIRHFWPRLVAGGVMILDDYGFSGYEAQREVHHQMSREFGFSILALPTGQGLVIRPPGVS
jgi:hypothetical protein